MKVVKLEVSNILILVINSYKFGHRLDNSADFILPEIKRDVILLDFVVEATFLQDINNSLVLSFQLETILVDYLAESSLGFLEFAR